MFRRFSTTILLLICMVQSCVIIYFGSGLLINTLLVPQDNYNNQYREAVNVVVANRENFTGSIITYGKIKSISTALKIPNLGHHKVMVEDVHFTAGDFVHKGMPLVTLNCEELKHKLNALQKDCEQNEKYLQRILKTPTNISDYEQEAAKIKLDKSVSEYLALKSFVQSLNIHAPFSGYIGIPEIVVGEQAVSDKHITNIVSQGKGSLIVEFYIDPEESVHVKTGDNVVISTIDISFHNTATVIGINPYIDENNSKVKVVAKLLDENNEIFKHNLNVKIYIDKNTIHNVFILPTNTIIEEGGLTYIAKVERGYNGYETRIIGVTLIDKKGKICAITSEILNVGDYVVYEGVIKRDGVGVYVKEIID